MNQNGKKLTTTNATIAAGLAGAAIGAAATAAAIALSDKKTRDKLGTKIKEFQATGQKTFNDWNTRARDFAMKGGQSSAPSTEDHDTGSPPQPAKSASETTE